MPWAENNGILIPVFRYGWQKLCISNPLIFYIEMKSKFYVATALSICALALGAKDAVIMTVNGVDVPKSEFEYLYHKNSQQQLSPQSLQDYAELFKIYKLKVADALAEGLDTLPAFRKEILQYRKELAEPYLTDSVFIDRLVEEAAERCKTDVEASHIMLVKGKNATENKVIRQRLDSIRNLLLNGADFEETALKYSEDRSVKSNKGSLGFIQANRYLYPLEMAAYGTPEGGYSEIVESPSGYHIIKSGKRRPAKGRIRASHIMKMVPRDATPEAEAAAKVAIDSLYAIVKADPSRFAEVAKASSDDRGSAVQGGDLSWFGSGDMVPEFEEAAYALSEGGISLPVKSKFGWHIIMLTGVKGAPTYDEIHDMLVKRMNDPRDTRYGIIRKHQTDQLAAKHNGRIIDSTLAALKESLTANGLDSLFIAKYSGAGLGDLPIVEIDGKSVPVKEYVLSVADFRIENPDDAALVIDDSLASFFNSELVEKEEDWLYENEDSYHNLLKEYHDGSLLYEISLRKVWDKASKDKDGLEAYFNANKGNYTWTKPRVKGILVQAAGDSVADAIKARMNELPNDSILPKIRKEFKGKASFERVLAEKGANQMVDNLMFDGPEVKPSSANYTVYFLYEPRLIEAPEEVADVKVRSRPTIRQNLRMRGSES